MSIMDVDAVAGGGGEYDGYNGGSGNQCRSA